MSCITITESLIDADDTLTKVFHRPICTIWRCWTSAQNLWRNLVWHVTQKINRLVATQSRLLNVPIHQDKTFDRHRHSSQRMELSLTASQTIHSIADSYSELTALFWNSGHRLCNVGDYTWSTEYHHSAHIFENCITCHTPPPTFRVQITWVTKSCPLGYLIHWFYLRTLHITMLMNWWHSDARASLMLKKASQTNVQARDYKIIESSFESLNFLLDEMTQD